MRVASVCRVTSQCSPRSLRLGTPHSPTLGRWFMEAAINLKGGWMWLECPRRRHERCVAAVHFLTQLRTLVWSSTKCLRRRITHVLCLKRLLVSPRIATMMHLVAPASGICRFRLGLGLEGCFGILHIFQAFGVCCIELTILQIMPCSLQPRMPCCARSLFVV